MRFPAYLAKTSLHWTMYTYNIYIYIRWFWTNIDVLPIIIVYIHKLLLLDLLSAGLHWLFQRYVQRTVHHRGPGSRIKLHTTATATVATSTCQACQVRGKYVWAVSKLDSRWFQCSSYDRKVNQITNYGFNMVRIVGKYPPWVGTVRIPSWVGYLLHQPLSPMTMDAWCSPTRQIWQTILYW